MTPQHYMEAVVSDEEVPGLNEDIIDEIFDENCTTSNLVRGIPDGDICDYQTDYDEYYNGLHRRPPNTPLDHTVLTEAELRERWGCNSETLIRILKNCELMIEHKKLKNRMGTYEELSRKFVAEGFEDYYVFGFFDLSEDGLFRASDVLEFENTHPEVMRSLRLESASPVETPLPHIEPNLIPPPHEPSTLDFSEYPHRAPEGQDLIDAIEQYLHNHPINLNNKEQVLDWVRNLSDNLEDEYPNFTKKKLWLALEEWRKVGAFVTSKSQFYKILGKAE
jgi:hypothetical protein